MRRDGWIRPTDPNAESRHRTLIEDLLATWDDELGSSEVMRQPLARRGKKITGQDLARMAGVIGLARDVHDTARAVVLLIDAGLTNAAVALVRKNYETSLTAVWLVQSAGQHGVTAFAREHARQRSALRRDALAATSEVFVDGASDIADTDIELYGETADSARQFAQICMDLAPGGKDAYVIYRVLSAHAHPGADVVDQYFGEPNALGVPVRLDRPQDAFSPTLLLHLTASSMVWAGRAFSYLTRSTTHRSLLRDTAASLGITSELKLSDAYYRRHATATRTNVQRRSQR